MIYDGRYIQFLPFEREMNNDYELNNANNTELHMIYLLLYVKCVRCKITFQGEFSVW
jgi:hypothetical protein